MRVPMLSAIALLAAGPALAQDLLRLSCTAADGGTGLRYAFSISLAEKDAVEVNSGRRYGLTDLRDALELFDPAGGAKDVVFRINRITGDFARVDRQIRFEGSCTKVDRPALE